MFKIKNLLITELILIVLWFVWNGFLASLLFDVHLIKEFFCPPCPEGYNCLSVVCMNLLQVLVNWLIVIVFVLYPITFLLNKLKNYFQKNKLK